MARYLVMVGESEFDIVVEDKGDEIRATIDGDAVDLERTLISQSRSVLLVNDDSLEVDVRSSGNDGEKLVFMRGQEIEVRIENYQLAQLRKRAGMAIGPVVESLVKAPMPGLLLECKVAVGQTVTKGEPLLIIEAMKMENVIKAPTDGTIKAIPVSKGQSVEKSDTLVEFE